MTLSIARLGSFHIGGKAVTVDGLETLTMQVTSDSPPITVEQNGQFEAFQMYVQYVKLANSSRRQPILFWHGGSLTGSTWEDTPDGRPGWQTSFLSAGYDTYISDAVERGRSSWARSPQIYPSQPIFRSNREAWRLFRIGPELGEPFAGTQFPYEAFENLAKSIVPRWTCNDQPTLDAYAALLDRVGPSVIVAHSQGAAFALEMASRKPQSVKAVIALEPTGVPHHPDERLRSVPHLFVWGDHVKEHFFWGAPRIKSFEYHGNLRALGVESTFVDLPERNIHGNSHMLMSDRNTDRIVELIAEWLKTK